MKLNSCVTQLCVGLLFVLGACGDGAVADPQRDNNPTGPFQLTFQGDASFQGPHGGHSISVAVVRISDGAVVARQTGTVSASADPAFSFTFSGLLSVGAAYEVHYWIDSNFDGGTAGVCDPKATDHQWTVAIASVQGDVTITEVHNAAQTVDVCSTFTANLTFAVDASFQGPHGGHFMSVAVVRTSDGAVVARQAGTISASADPALSLTFSGLLVVGAAYEVHYWIDSNFGGGTVMVCDPKENDHQWNVAVAAVEGDITITEAHNAANTVDVCSTFMGNLTFAGDASFQGPHGGHSMSVAVVRASDGAVVARQTGTVSASADPAFSFTFSGLLVVGFAYEVHYWIDSNFDGGTAGVCDPKANDHQWMVTIGAVEGDVTVTEAHNAANTVDVCSTFGSGSSSTWRVNEPEGYATIVGRSFNSKASDDADRGTGEFPYKSEGSEGWDGIESRAGRFTIVEDATAPVSPANVAQIVYTEGMNGGSAPATLQTQGFSTVYGVNYKEMYVAYAFKISTGFDGHRTSTNKMFHYWAVRQNRIFGRLVGADDNPLEYQIGLQGNAPGCETRSRLIPNQGVSGILNRGEWYKMELQFVLNTAGTCDGVFRVWANGTKIIEYTDVGILRTGEENAVFNQLQLSPTWGGGGDVVLQQFFLWMDEVYVSGRQ